MSRPERQIWKGGLILAISLLFVQLLTAATTGKLSGTVKDAETGEPILEANILIYTQSGDYIGKGAATDWDGNYFIIGVDPGVYDVLFTNVSYDSLWVTEVRISSDKTTTQDVEMTQGVATLGAIRVKGKRPQVEKGEVKSIDYTTAEDLEKMPVDDINEVLETSASITSREGELHFRGSRGNEVQTYVNGMPVQDPTYGYTALDVSTSAVSEVSVTAGSFQAEYGGAMSAIVNIVTKEGDPSITTGGFLYRTDNFRVDALNKFSNNSDRLEFNLSGPEPFTGFILPALGMNIPRNKKISYFLSVTGENSDSWLRYNYKYDFDEHMYTWDELNSPYNLDYGWYGFFPERRSNAYAITLKLKQKITPNIKYTINYSGNFSRQRLWDWYYQYTPQSSYVYKSQSQTMNINLTHNLSPSTFYELRAGRFFVKRERSPDGRVPGDFAVDSVSYWNTLDDWHDVNQDGIAQVRQPWLDYNHNGMYDYGEPFFPLVEKADTFFTGDGAIDRIDTVYIDSLPPQLGEEPWYDLNENGIFEPKTTNFNTSFYGTPVDLQEPFMDGEPFRDGYSQHVVGGQLVQIEYHDPSFIDDTLWVDVNRDGIKSWGEFVFGPYYRNYEIALEETTWNDLNGDGDVDIDEYIDVNLDGQYTTRDKAYYGYNYPEFNDLNGNGRYDVGEPGEPFYDMNGNGYWDPPNGLQDEWEPYVDINDNGQWDGIDGFNDRGYDRYAVWSDRETEIWMLKGDLTSQVNQENQIKTGFEAQFVRIEMNQIQYPEAYYDGTPDGMNWPSHGVFRSFYERSPKQLAFYVQDKMEYGGLIANIGVRADVFLQASEVLEDSLEQQILDVIGPEIGFEVVPSRTKISPRLGMSYPVTDKSKLFFSYGHFYQLPGYDNMYTTPTQGGSALRLIGNPSLDFQKTVSYEIGIAYAITDLMTFQLSGYYRDIYDLLNTTTMQLGPLTQSVYENVDYGRSRGIELSFDKSYNNYWTLTSNYQFSFAYGKSSSNRSGYDAILDQTAIPLRDLPLNWDQRHSVMVNIDLRARKDDHPVLFGYKMPDDWGASIMFTWGTGFPYTPSEYNPNWDVKPGEKAWERTNALRMPDQYNLDFRVNKNFTLAKLDWQVFLDIDNVTNRRNVDNVYSDTGLPDDPFVLDGLGNGDPYYSDPTHWTSPRNIKLGVKMSF